MTSPATQPGNWLDRDRVVPAPRRSASRWSQAVLYPNCYVWYVLLASLDIMLTGVILASGGFELNTIAEAVIDRWSVPGMVVYKFTLVMLVVLICEVIGRQDDRLGRKVAEWSVAITAIPVVLALMQLLFKVYVVGEQAIETSVLA